MSYTPIMSYSPGEKARQEELKATLKIMERRLAGNKTYQLAVDQEEAALRVKGNIDDYLRHRARGDISDCLNCNGLKVDEAVDNSKRVKYFRFTCGRSKPSSTLVCDDGASVFLNEKKEIAFTVVKGDWASLVAPMPSWKVGADTFKREYMVHDELTALSYSQMRDLERKNAETGFVYTHKEVKPIDKDKPQTAVEGDDSW